MSPSYLGPDLQHVAETTQHAPLLTMFLTILLGIQAKDPLLHFQSIHNPRERKRTSLTLFLPWDQPLQRMLESQKTYSFGERGSHPCSQDGSWPTIPFQSGSFSHAAQCMETDNSIPGARCQCEPGHRSFPPAPGAESKSSFIS